MSAAMRAAPVLGSCPKFILVPFRRLTCTRDWETGESLATSIVFVFTNAIARAGPCEKLMIVLAAAVVVSIADTVVGPPRLLKLVPIRVEPLNVRPSMSPRPVLPIKLAAPVVLLTEYRFPRKSVPNRLPPGETAKPCRNCPVLPIGVAVAAGALL